MTCLISNSFLTFANGKIVHILSAEVRALLGTGGLQHVIVDKANAMQAAGYDVRIVMPMYESIDQSNLKNLRIIEGSEATALLDKQGRFHNVHAKYRILEFSHPENEALKILGVQHLPGEGYQ